MMIIDEHIPMALTDPELLYDICATNFMPHRIKNKTCRIGEGFIKYV